MRKLNIGKGEVIKEEKKIDNNFLIDTMLYETEELKGKTIALSKTVDDISRQLDYIFTELENLRKE